MKKSLILFASLAFGTAAIAQDTPAGAPMQGSPPTTNTPAPATPPMDNTMPPAASAPAPSDNGMAPPAGTAAAPTPGPGSDMVPGAASPAPAAAPTDTSSYPRCTRTVTDKCVQGGPTRHRPRK